MGVLYFGLHRWFTHHGVFSWESIGIHLLTFEKTRLQAVLLHRMHNVVIPSSRRSRRAYRTLFHQTTVWERIHAMILPLDISRTTTRLILHIPSVYFLTKMLLVWIVLALQTCEISLSFFDTDYNTYWGGVLRFVETLGTWAMKKDMSHVCWSTFCAVCGAFLVEGFIKTLDGLGRNGFPLSGVNNLSPFHLVSLLDHFEISFANPLIDQLCIPLAYIFLSRGTWIPSSK